MPTRFFTRNFFMKVTFVTYSEPGFNISLQENLLRFSGKIERFDYSALEHFFEQVEEALPDHDCLVDMTGLLYLNSRGLRTFVNYILKSNHAFTLRINNSAMWQKQSLPMLKFLRPERITIVTE